MQEQPDKPGTMPLAYELRSELEAITAARTWLDKREADPVQSQQDAYITQLEARIAQLENRLNA